MVARFDSSLTLDSPRGSVCLLLLIRQILSVYVSGSKNMSYDSASLTTPDIKWLGIRPSDLDRYNIPAQCRLQMSDHDIKTGKELLEEEFIKKNPEWLKELESMVRSKEKAEIQA